MLVQSGAFRIRRTAGAGDRQRVRSGLLQVLILDEETMSEAFLGVHEACRRLGFRFRAHISANIDKKLSDKIDFELLGKWRNDDTDVVRFKDMSRLEEHVDLVIRRTEGEVNVKDIIDGVEYIMTRYPRMLIKYEHQHLPVRELKELYPDYYLMGS
jgi:hypothetical protein